MTVIPHVYGGSLQISSGVINVLNHPWVTYSTNHIIDVWILSQHYTWGDVDARELTHLHTSNSRARKVFQVLDMYPSLPQTKLRPQSLCRSTTQIKTCLSLWNYVCFQHVEWFQGWVKNQRPAMSTCQHTIAYSVSGQYANIRHFQYTLKLWSSWMEPAFVRLFPAENSSRCSSRCSHLRGTNTAWRRGPFSI